MKKGVFENFAKFTGKHLWFAKFSKNTFFREQPWTTASDFFVQRYKNGVLPTMFGKTQMNIHYLETLTLEVPFRYIIYFLAA